MTPVRYQCYSNDLLYTCFTFKNANSFKQMNQQTRSWWLYAATRCWYNGGILRWLITNFMDPSVGDRKIYQNTIYFLYFIANNHPNQEQIVINDAYRLSTNTQHAQFIRDFCKGYFSLQCRGPFLCINTQYQCQRVSRNNNSKRLLYHISRDLYFVLFSYSF